MSLGFHRGEPLATRRHRAPVTAIPSQSTSLRHRAWLGFLLGTLLTFSCVSKNTRLCTSFSQRHAGGEISSWVVTNADRAAAIWASRPCAACW